MITSTKFDLGNGGYTTSYRCSDCFASFEINFLYITKDTNKAYRVQTTIDDLQFCPFCGKKAI